METKPPSFGAPGSPLAGFLSIARQIRHGHADKRQTKDWAVRAESLPRFAEAEAAWLAAWPKVMRRMKLEGLVNPECSASAMAGFLACLMRFGEHPEEILVKFSPLIAEAAARGDVDFSRKLGSALRSRRTAKRNNVAFEMMLEWLSGLLWLMSDRAGCDALNAYLGRTGQMRISLDSYTKERGRLGLLSYEVMDRQSPIETFMPKLAAYRPAKGWTKWFEGLSSRA
jgi:hypothetical protein